MRWAFQKRAPAASIANSIFSGFWMSAVELALGRSSLTAWVSSGAVTMKITSSTSTTSINGTMLISAIGWLAFLLRSKLPKAMAVSSGLLDGAQCHAAGAQRAALQGAAHRQEGQQLEGEGVELGVEHAVGTGQPVVAHHRRQRDGEADAGHDQRLADWPRDLVEHARAGHADGDQRVINAPHRAEQADERRGGADGGKHGEAVLERGGLLVEHLLDGAGQELLLAARLLELAGAELLVMRLGVQRMGGEMAERLLDAVHAELVLDRLERGGAPEEGEELPAALLADHLADALVDDQVPRDRRHQRQHDQQHLRHDVGVEKEVAEAQGGRVSHAAPTLTEHEVDRNVDPHRLRHSAFRIGPERGGAHRAQRRVVERRVARRLRQRDLGRPAD